MYSRFKSLTSSISIIQNLDNNICNNLINHKFSMNTPEQELHEWGDEYWKIKIKITKIDRIYYLTKNKHTYNLIARMNYGKNIYIYIQIIGIHTGRFYRYCDGYVFFTKNIELFMQKIIPFENFIYEELKEKKENNNDNNNKS